MGFNTVVVVLNDRLDEIERDPEFGKKLVAAIHAFNPNNPERTPYVTGQTKVVGQDHSAWLCAYVVGGNTGKYLGYCGEAKNFDDNDGCIKELVASHRRNKL